jgi:hypothetical protein
MMMTMMMTMTMRRMLPWSDTDILSSSSSMPRSTPYRTQAQLFILAGPIVFARETCCHFAQDIQERLLCGRENELDG